MSISEQFGEKRLLIEGVMFNDKIVDKIHVGVICVDILRYGAITPGKSIGPFEIGCNREALISLLGKNYEVETRANFIVIKTETYWFWIDDTDSVSQIRIFNGFFGKFGGKIGIGNTLKDVVNNFGKCSYEKYTYFISAIPGICFELKDVEDYDDEWDEMSAPIESIYVFAIS
ncbi:hypothetical protein ACFO9Q_20355 [Paenibacillus sp. GCM10023252]|uniref:hypothetical protein n=1 Tax=Paenibacillus sp. GCM10023252 TaxID=3252649 RepID=UPI0036063B22